MATISLNGNLILQDHPPATTRAQPAPRPRAGEEAENLGDRIRQEVQAEIEAATQGVHPTPPSREFIIRGPDGRQTVVGMPPPGEIIPPQAVDIAFGFFWMVAAIIIGLPIARAFARRMDRKGGTANVPNEISAQLAQLNQAVDAIALEVERISEGQRFTTRLISEQRDAGRQTLPSGAQR
jgi:hypothetical protein